MKTMGVILAGGKSTRMKQDKAMLNFEGTHLLQRQFQMLESLLGTGNVIVSGDRPNYLHVKDSAANSGPVEGLSSVLHFLKNRDFLNRLLIVPIDMPLMTQSELSRLIRSDVDATVIKFKDYPLPFVVNRPALVLDTIEKMKTDTLRKISFKNLFGNLETHEMKTDNPKIFANINTPEDWIAALS